MVNLKNFIRLLALIVTVAVLVEGVVVNFLLEDTKINGPVYQRITADKEDFGLLPSYPGRYMSRVIQEFRELGFDSPLAEAACPIRRAGLLQPVLGLKVLM